MTPTVRYCILAENVRPETGNKLTILGYYGVLPYVDIQTEPGPEEARTILTFVIGFAENQLKFQMLAKLIAPSGKVVTEGPSTPVEFLPEHKQNALILGFYFLPVQESGKYSLVLEADGKRFYEGSFGMTVAKKS